MEKFLKNIFATNAEVIGFGEWEHGNHELVLKELAPSLNLFHGIFIEISVSFQSSINNYLITGYFDDDLIGLLDGALEEGNDFIVSDKTILNSADMNNLPVVCIDSSKFQNEEYSKKAKEGFWYLKGKTRDEDMFTNIMDNLQKKPGKWFIFAHAAHLDGMLEMPYGGASLGKRLKEKLTKKYFNVCLLKNPGISTIKYYFNEDKLNPELSEILNKNNKLFLTKSFDAFIIHP